MKYHNLTNGVSVSSKLTYVEWFLGVFAIFFAVIGLIFELQSDLLSESRSDSKIILIIGLVVVIGFIFYWYSKLALVILFENKIVITKVFFYKTVIRLDQVYEMKRFNIKAANYVSIKYKDAFRKSNFYLRLPHGEEQLIIGLIDRLRKNCA